MKKNVCRLIIIMLLFNFLLDIIPTGSATGYVYMDMEDGVLPYFVTQRANHTLDSNSTLDGVNCLNITYEYDWCLIYGALTQEFVYDTPIRPDRWSCKILIDNYTTNDYIKVYVGDSYSASIMNIYFYTSDMSMKVITTSTREFVSTWEFNMPMEIVFSNIDYTDKTFDITVINDTSSETLSDCVFSNSIVDPLIYNFMISSGTIAQTRVFVDSWTLGTNIEVDTGSNTVVNDTYVSLDGTVVNDGSPLQNNSTDNITLRFYYDTINNTNTHTFYFNGYDAGGEEWDQNPESMVDGAEDTSGVTDVDNETELLTGNNCTISGNVNITRVEIRCLQSYAGSLESANVDVRPVFNGTDDGDNHNFVCTSKGWTSYFDITNDTNATSTWSWNDITNLDCDIQARDVGGGHYASVYKVEIRVTTVNFSSNNLQGGYYTGDSFNIDVTGLSPGTVYYYRAFGNTSYGNGSSSDWGDEQSFLTKPSNASTLSYNGTSTGMNVSWTHGVNYTSSVLIFKTTGYPSNVSDGTILYNGSNSFYNHNNLVEGTTYYYRLWEHTVGGGFNQFSPGHIQLSQAYVGPPSVTTNAASSVTAYSATLNGVIDDDGGESCTAMFYYDTQNHSLNQTSEYYTVESDGSFDLDAYCAQTFTIGTVGTNEYFEIAYALIYINNVGSSFTAHIRNVNNTGYPTNINLTNGTFIGSMSGNQWYRVNFSTQYRLYSNTKYALVVHGDGNWWADSTSPTYTGGSFFNSADDGITWSESLSKDALFRLYGSNDLDVYSYNSSVSSFYSTAETFSSNVDSLTSGMPYYYRAYANNSFNTSNYDWGDEQRFLCKPEAPTNMLATVINSTSINISWTKGIGANNTIIVSNTNNKPNSVTDGTVIYNDTGNYHVVNNLNNNDLFYYRIWSWANWSNPDLNIFSSNYTDVDWGALIINCYDETTHSNLTFDVFISNQDGTEVYENTSCTNPHTINFSLCPNGDDINIIISSDNYEDRIYVKDLLEDAWYFLDTYLPLSLPPEGEDDPDYDPENYSYSNLYRLTVVDEVENTIEDVKLEVKRYINTTEVFENVSVGYTDGNGNFDVYLIAGELYKVRLSKTNYVTKTVGYIPSDLIFTRTFKLYFEETETQPPAVETNEITFNGYISGSTLYVNYTDNLNQTVNTTIKVYEYNHSTNIETLLYTDNMTGNNSYQVNFNINTSNTYTVILYYNHSTFGYQTHTLLFEGISSNIPITTQATGDNLLTLNFKTNPFGWTNTIMFFFAIFILFESDEENTGVWLAICGFILLALNVYIGFNATLSSVASGSIPIIMIAAGIALVIKNRQKVNTG